MNMLGLLKIRENVNKISKTISILILFGFIRESYSIEIGKNKELNTYIGISIKDKLGEYRIPYQYSVIAFYATIQPEIVIKDRYVIGLNTSFPFPNKKGLFCDDANSKGFKINAELSYLIVRGTDGTGIGLGYGFGFKNEKIIWSDGKKISIDLFGYCTANAPWNNRAQDKIKSYYIGPTLNILIKCFKIGYSCNFMKEISADRKYIEIGNDSYLYNIEPQIGWTHEVTILFRLPMKK